MKRISRVAVTFHEAKGDSGGGRMKSILGFLCAEAFGPGATISRTAGQSTIGNWPANS
jgi:hypothetical protein